MANGIIKKAERFEMHHRIVVFAIIMIGCIFVTRFLVLFHDPKPMFFNMELHHFDYGIFLLLISSQLALFGPKRFHFLYILMTAIASGLILDEYWMIRHGVVHAATPAQEYNSTLYSSMVFSVGFLLLILFVNSIRKHRKH